MNVHNIRVRVSTKTTQNEKRRRNKSQEETNYIIFSLDSTNEHIFTKNIIHNSLVWNNIWENEKKRKKKNKS